MPESKARKKIAIVTGASSGLGAEFALQIEKKFFLDEIWLVARRATPMRNIADKFLKSKAVIMPFDLTNRTDLAAIERKLSEEKPEVECLVNNAGYGKLGPVAELGVDEQTQMIDLNVTALTHLTRTCLPYMQKGSKIIQVASSIAFSPSPYFAVYAATKAYVVSFSDALGYELRSRGIQVIAVCPGPVETEFFAVAQKNEYMKDRVGQVEPFNRALFAAPKDVVAKALKDLENGKRHSVYGALICLFALFSGVIPTSIKLRALSSRDPKNH